MQEAKKQLRKKIIEARLELSPEEVTAKSEKIIRKLVSLPVYRQAGTIMTYVAFNNEVETRGLIKHSLAEGKKVYVPVTRTKEKRLVPAEIFGLEDLVPGTWGILEPKPECLRPRDPRDIDLVVVPGVAFDKEGNRLGYGGGYYDRFLSKLRGDCCFVALCYQLQIRDEVYTEVHDQPVHMVITEEQVIS